MTDEKMPFTEHLTELQKKNHYFSCSASCGFSVSFSYSENIFDVLTLPLRSEIGLQHEYPFVSRSSLLKIKNPTLVFLAPAEAFWMHLKVSFVVGLMLVLPVILYQLWKFISPGLLCKGKKVYRSVRGKRSLLFLAGAAFLLLLCPSLCHGLSADLQDRLHDTHAVCG